MADEPSSILKLARLDSITPTRTARYALKIALKTGRELISSFTDHFINIPGFTPADQVTVTVKAICVFSGPFPSSLLPSLRPRSSTSVQVFTFNSKPYANIVCPPDLMPITSLLRAHKDDRFCSSFLSISTRVTQTVIQTTTTGFIPTETITAITTQYNSSICFTLTKN